MKKIYLSIMLAAVAMSGCADNSQKLRVCMNCQGVGDTITVILGDNDEARQTFTGRQGTFQFDIDVPQVTTLTLAEPGIFRGDRTAKYYQIPAVPGCEAIVTQKAGETRYDIEGTGFYTQYHQADLMVEEAQKPMKAFVDKCQQMMASGTPQDSVMQYYQEGSKPLLEALHKTVTDYIRAHADEEASAALVNQFSPDVEQMRAAAQLLSPAVREGRCKSLYQTVIDKLQAEQEAEAKAASLQAAGREAPDFTLNDLNGRPLSLKSLRGKYVILDFWGSWCIWCIKGFPEMKNYYEKYRGKFEILGIDCNDSDAKWRAAVEKHQLPWLHVYNPRDSRLLEQYGIQGFPTKIIVGPDGKIVKTIVGEDPQFYTLLDSLFK